MKATIKITGTDNLKATLAKRIAQGQDAEVEVGYTANYALYVHEMEGANFQRPGAQAKFLETPLRQRKDEWVGIVGKVVEGGGTFQQGLFVAGLQVQRASQDICPVDTGNLRASAYTRKVK